MKNAVFPLCGNPNGSGSGDGGRCFPSCLVVLVGMIVALFLLFTALQSAIAGQKAVLIGVGEYPHHPDWRLDGPRRDVQAMRSFLIDEWGFFDTDIRVIKDRDASKQGILDAIGNWLPRASRRGDRVVIYYSGHGSQVDDVSGDEADGKDETFVPNDYGSNPKCARQTIAIGDRAECARQMVLDDELAVAIGKLLGRVVIVIADSCNSGTVTKDLRVDSLDAKARYFPFPTSSKGFVRTEEAISEEIDVHLTISAALPHQLAWERKGSGIFTELFIEALTDKRADLSNNGTVTTAELINYVKEGTEKWCLADPVCSAMKLGFTPNIDPRNETFVLQPFDDGGLQTVSQNDVGAISDILPEFARETISIDILPWHSVTVGENVSFRVTSTEAGHLTLFDLDSEGTLTLLFPTRDDIEAGISGAILANQPLTVPNERHDFFITASEPLGPGRTVAIVTKDLFDFDYLLSQHRDYRPIGNGVGLMKSIAAHLYEVWTGDDENRGAQWSVGYADYDIRPK